MSTQASQAYLRKRKFDERYDMYRIEHDYIEDKKLKEKQRKVNNTEQNTPLDKVNPQSSGNCKHQIENPEDPATKTDKIQIKNQHISQHTTV